MSKRFLWITLSIASVHLVLTVAGFATAFSRGMNQLPRTWFDQALSAVLPVLLFPQSLLWQQVYIPRLLMNSLLWGIGLAVATSYLRDRRQRSRIAT